MIIILIIKRKQIVEIDDIHFYNTFDSNMFKLTLKALNFKYASSIGYSFLYDKNLDA
jgi:hypothetical protein